MGTPPHVLLIGVSYDSAYQRDFEAGFRRKEGTNTITRAEIAHIHLSANSSQQESIRTLWSKPVLVSSAPLVVSWLDAVNLRSVAVKEFFSYYLALLRSRPLQSVILGMTPNTHTVILQGLEGFSSALSIIQESIFKKPDPPILYWNCTDAYTLGRRAAERV